MLLQVSVDDVEELQTWTPCERAMRRADRLFRLIQLLRPRRQPMTASALADRLGVSVRTVYRDIADLVDSGVPLRGEAGVGYVLSPSYELPPLMFDEREIEALVFGARLVGTWADPELAEAGARLMEKVEAVLPDHLRQRIEATSLYSFGLRTSGAQRELLGRIRRAIERRAVLELEYVDGGQAPTRRQVRPLGLFYWGPRWTMAAWCELRRDFRNFRLDRIVSLEETASHFEPEPGKTLEDLFRQYEEGA